MLNYTTCADCKNILAVSWVGQETHPTCKPTRTEQLTRDWLEAAQRGGDLSDGQLREELDKKSSPKLGASAIWYAQQGWPVFPLRPGAKLPAIPTAHPEGDPLRGKCKGECGKLGHGLYDAVINLEQIKTWWDRDPTCNIGLPTGIRFDVIDIDGPQGFQSFARLDDDVVPDVHGRVYTPRGLHLYVKPTGDGNRAGVFPGIDYRGAGGYVVGPPSMIGLERWSWLMAPSPKIIGEKNDEST